MEIDITQRFEDLWKILAEKGASEELHDIYLKGCENIAREIMHVANVKDLGNEQPEPIKVKVKAKKTFTINGIAFKRGHSYPVDNIEIWADIHEEPDFVTGSFNQYSVGYKHRKVVVKGSCGVVNFYDERTALDWKKPFFDDYFEELDLNTLQR